jgi:putative ABC transport system substrate-binding protein
MPVVGVMGSSTAGTVRRALAALRSGLQGTGYVEGQNVAIEYRFADGQFDRLPAMLSDLIRNGATVLVTASSGAIAAKRTNTTIPVVFVTPSDPLELGLVDSINRPGGNFTGVHMFAAGLEGKRLGLLHEVVPKATTIAVLINSNFSAASGQSRDVQEAAVRVGVQPVIAHANTESDFDAAFTTFVQRKAGALLVCASPFFNSRRRQLVVLAARHSLPAIYEWRDKVSLRHARKASD